MKSAIISTMALGALMLCACSSPSVENGMGVTVKYDSSTKTVAIGCDGRQVLGGVYASYKLGDRMVSATDYASCQTAVNEISDDFGRGRSLVLSYTGDSLPDLVQTYYVYDSLQYVLTDFTVRAKYGETATNYMAPVNATSIKAFPAEGDNRALFIPFDNDCFIRYQSHAMGFDTLRSYEVTAIFNNATREGIIIGSVEHDMWKTAVDMQSASGNELKSLVCYSGVADKTTRDSKAHGTVSGQEVKSPKILVGNFDDWRDGMEAYADANATVAAPMAWDKAMPFGWNSWGTLQWKLNFKNACEVSDYYANTLQPNNFQNADSVVYIGLDSGWNAMSEDQLKKFVEHCEAQSQVAGIYWTPFTDWSRNPERTIDAVPEYKNKDVYLYANGKPQELDGAYAYDPTHPAIEEMMKQTSELFRRCGFKYVKMDFMSHGIMEGDKWYNPEIHTGVEAYNYGMQLLDKYFGDMYLNLSISPIFPSQYAQSRRIACDAWNKIKDTEYTMNALSYGWWIDRVYQYNDADHIVLRDAEESENRARVTSSVITGLYIVGDDFSKTANPEVLRRAEKFLTNADVNAVADGRSFRPVEGNGERSESQFTRTEADGSVYYVAFNYTERDTTIRLSLDRIGIAVPYSGTMKDLWSGETTEVAGDAQELAIPAKDVRFVKFIANSK